MGSYSDELRMLRELTTRLDQTNSLLEAQNAILERILRSLSPANVTGSAGIRSTEAFGAGGSIAAAPPAIAVSGSAGIVSAEAFSNTGKVSRK